jgi:hypothetical protein
MTRSNSLRALTLSAILALGAPLSAFAAPGNTGGAAEASDFVASAGGAVTQGRVDVAANTGNAAQANGNALAGQAALSQRADSRHDLRTGNSASALGGFGTENRG